MSEFDENATEPGHSAEYGKLRARVRDVLAASDAAALDLRAPATPEWRVRDVLAHLVGVVDDVRNGRLYGVATDPWTDAQVNARKDCTVAEMLDEWDELSPAFEAGLAQLPMSITGQALFDAVTHEHDIRHALGQPGARDNQAVSYVFDWMVYSRTAAGRPALRFHTGNAVTVAGVGDPIATVKGSRFELLRATTGRRSASEIEALEWEPRTDAAQMLSSPIFTLRDEPLGE
jgi:uncharacterized protein (TIGR03083 family)